MGSTDDEFFLKIILNLAIKILIKFISKHCLEKPKERIFKPDWKKIV
jgi:hypothetical protein